MTKRVTGLGGIFFKVNDKAAMLAWYKKHLGINAEDWGAVFKFTDDKQPETAYTAWSTFKADTTYFAPSNKDFMINYRVDDLDALVELLKQEGVQLIGEPTNDDFGKFAWIMDPEGNKIELWEQPK
jgi:predicted enzyme related to lactoylglutathione lyase